MPPQAEQNAWNAWPEVDLREVNKSKEEVISECREHMSSPGKSKLLLCTLGCFLSQGARGYLRKMDQGLKSFLSQYPSEFSIEGTKGRESISYLPALARDGQNCSDLPADKTHASSKKASGEEDAPAKDEAGSAGLDADERRKSRGAGLVPSDFGVKLNVQKRYWCPVCSKGFVKWSQCRQHILTKRSNTCREQVVGVNVVIDEEHLQKWCLTRPRLQ